MSSGEVVTITMLFHYGAFRNLKHFYLLYVCRHMQGDFPQTVSYNRFVELMEKEALSMAVMLKMFCLGECTGISSPVYLATFLGYWTASMNANFYS